MAVTEMLMDRSTCGRQLGGASLGCDNRDTTTQCSSMQRSAIGLSWAPKLCKDHGGLSKSAPGERTGIGFFFGCATLLTTMKTRLHSANLTSEAHGDQSWAFLPQKDFLAFKDVYLSQEYRKHLLHSRQPGSLQGLIKISEGLMSNGRH